MFQNNDSLWVFPIKITLGRVLSIRILLIKKCFWQKSYWTKGFSKKNWSNHSGSISVAIMIWLTDTKYPFYKWQLISPHCPDNKFLYRSWVTPIANTHRLCLLRNTMGGTSEAGVANPSGTPENTLVIWGLCYSSFSV